MIIRKKNVLHLAEKLGLEIQEVSHPGDGMTRYCFVARDGSSHSFCGSRSAWDWLRGYEVGRKDR